MPKVALLTLPTSERLSPKTTNGEVKASVRCTQKKSSATETMRDEETKRRRDAVKCDAPPRTSSLRLSVSSSLPKASRSFAVVPKITHPPRAIISKRAGDYCADEHDSADQKRHNYADR